MDSMHDLAEEFTLLMPEIMAGFRKLLFDPPLLEDLTAPQFILMAYLSQQSSCNATAIGEAMHITSGSVTSLTDRMINHGFILRTPSSEDRRVAFFSLTEQGKVKLKAVQIRQNERLSAFFNLLGGEKAVALIALYRDMNKLLK